MLNRSSFLNLFVTSKKYKRHFVEEILLQKFKKRIDRSFNVCLQNNYKIIIFTTPKRYITRSHSHN